MSVKNYPVPLEMILSISMYMTVLHRFVASQLLISQFSWDGYLGASRKSNYLKKEEARTPLPEAR
jgi:hypothetical protein